MTQTNRRTYRGNQYTQPVKPESWYGDKARYHHALMELFDSLYQRSYLQEDAIKALKARVAALETEIATLRGESGNGAENTEGG